jgi:hypothetical protein
MTAVGDGDCPIDVSPAAVCNRSSAVDAGYPSRYDIGIYDGEKHEASSHDGSKSRAAFVGYSEYEKQESGKPEEGREKIGIATLKCGRLLVAVDQAIQPLDLLDARRTTGETCARICAAAEANALVAMFANPDSWGIVVGVAVHRRDIDVNVVIFGTVLFDR